MIKNRLYIILFLCSLWLALPLSHLSAQGKDFTLVIDPGHGGKDPGAIGKKGKEKNINLSVALKLGNLIQENCKDVNIVYTRQKDTFVALDRRAQIANSAKANFDYNNINGVKGYPVNSRETAQMTMPIKNKIDYGITAGRGAEWKINPRNSVLIEARYYFGLGNLFDSDKKAVFSSSRPSSIEVTAGYMFRIK